MAFDKQTYIQDYSSAEDAHLGVRHPLPHLESHDVNLDPPEDEVPVPAATYLSSTSTAPSSAAASSFAAINSTIATAIAALSARMHVIHKDLFKCIGQVHEHVDLIVECQAHDIKVVRDTLSALS